MKYDVTWTATSEYNADLDPEDLGLDADISEDDFANWLEAHSDVLLSDSHDHNWVDTHDDVEVTEIEAFNEDE